MKQHTTSKMFALVSGILLCLLATGCQNLEVSDVQYYYLLSEGSHKYLINNDVQTTLPQTVSDYLIKKNNHYAVGVADSHPYLMINGQTTKTWDFNSHQSPRIIDEGKDFYIWMDDAAPTGELDRLGQPMYGHRYYISKNGDEPYLVSFQIHTEIGGPLTEISQIRKCGEKFYITGNKDKVAVFCDADNLNTPMYLSLDLATTTGFVALDTNTFIISGYIPDNESGTQRACVWHVKGVNVEMEILDGTDEAYYSKAATIKQFGKDIYIGGSIGDYPVIWKNQKVWAVNSSFPPYRPEYRLTTDFNKIYTYRGGTVVTMEKVGNKIYSFVQTKSTQGGVDSKIMAVEWDLSQHPIQFEYKYDLVKMLQDKTIVMDPYFYNYNQDGKEKWGHTYFGHMRICLN